MKTKFSLLIFILVGCTNSNLKSSNKKYNKIVNENGIASLTINNLRGEIKDIKIKSDITKVVILINSVKIIKYNSSTETKLGVGYGVLITYSNGKKEALAFTGGKFMTHNNKSYVVDKDISNEIKGIYEKN